MRMKLSILLTWAVLTPMASASDLCTSKLNTYLSDWEHKLNTYTIKDLRNYKSGQLKEWSKRQSDGESDCKIWHSLPEQWAKREALETLFGTTSTRSR